MSPLYKVESKKFTESHQKIQFLLWNLKSFNVCCPPCLGSSASVYGFITASNATRASHVSNGAGTLPPATLQGVKPVQVPDGFLEFFLWSQLEWKNTSATCSLSFSILLKLIWDQPATLHFPEQHFPETGKGIEKRICPSLLNAQPSIKRDSSLLTPLRDTVWECC